MFPIFETEKDMEHKLSLSLSRQEVKDGLMKYMTRVTEVVGDNAKEQLTYTASRNRMKETFYEEIMSVIT